MKEFTWWMNTLINGISEKDNKNDNESIIEKCGKACFQGCNITEAIIECKRNTNNIDDLLSELNKTGIGGGNLKIEDNTITGVYEKCYCTYRNALGDGISPEFCNCTKGWAKSFFEIVLDRPVEVELIQAIGRGDKVCKFAVKLT